MTILTAMRWLWLFVCAGLSWSVLGQVPSGWKEELEAYWARIEEEFRDTATTPLKPEDLARFEHLERFPVDSNYRVRVSFTPVEGADPFVMRTTKTQTPLYKEHGILRFTLNGTDHSLHVYQSMPPHTGHEDEVFVPFTDLTNGRETYGVGRYLDLRLPLQPEMMVDFNRAYNPYCAYNDRYSCPVPPSENHLTTEVRAGVLDPHW